MPFSKCSLILILFEGLVNYMVKLRCRSHFSSKEGHKKAGGHVFFVAAARVYS